MIARRRLNHSSVAKVEGSSKNISPSKRDLHSISFWGAKRSIRHRFCSDLNDRAEALEPFLCSEGGRQFKKHKPLEKRSPFNLFLGSQKKYKTPILFIASISPQPVEKKINIHLDNLI